MIKTNYFDGLSVTGDDLIAPWASLLQDGVAKLTDLGVASNSPAGLSVRVGAGAGVKSGYFVRSDATEVVLIAANTSGYKRIDLIVLDINPTKKEALILAVPGQPSSAPVAPTAGALQLPLAQVQVGNNSSVIDDIAITDVRALAKINNADRLDGYDSTDFLRSIGGSVTGNIYISRVGQAGYAYLTLDSDKKQYAGIPIRSAGKMRWLVASNDTDETGANKGCDFVISRYDDAGIGLGVAFQISRETGEATFSSNLNVGGIGYVTGNVITQGSFLFRDTNNVNRAQLANDYANQRLILSAYDNAGANAKTIYLSNSLGLHFNDGVDIDLGTGTGTRIGASAAQKIGFHGATPTAQRSGAAQVAVATTAATNTTPYGFTTAAQANSIVTLVNEIRACIVEKGWMKGSA